MTEPAGKKCDAVVASNEATASHAILDWLEGRGYAAKGEELHARSMGIYDGDYLIVIVAKPGDANDYTLDTLQNFNKPAKTIVIAKPAALPANGYGAYVRIPLEPDRTKDVLAALGKLFPNKATKPPAPRQLKWLLIAGATVLAVAVLVVAVFASAPTSPKPAYMTTRSGGEVSVAPQGETQ